MRGRSDNETAHRRDCGLLRSLRQLVVVLHQTLRDLPARRWYLTAFCAILLGCLLAIVRHEPDRVPPSAVFFAGLPVSGKLDDALRAGFDDCFATNAVNMRCRRHEVTIANTGPYEAAVDLTGSRGSGGFDQLVVWHDRDNYAVFQIADALRRAGWQQWYTGDDRWGDQSISTRSGFAVRASMDMSYYSKRRMRIMPKWNDRERRCVPGQ